MKSLPFVSIVIPTHNRKEKLVRLIHSILNSDYPKKRLEIIVVDDASTDGTSEIIKDNFKKVKLLQTKIPHFSAYSRELGAKNARGEFIFFVDDDNVIEKNTIRALVDAMVGDKSLAAAGPLMLHYSNKNRIWCAGGKVGLFVMPFHLYAKNEYTRKNLPSIIYDVDYFPNAYMVKRDVLKEVKHNPQLFPHNWNEIDFFTKLKRKGYNIATVTDSVIYHDVVSSGKITRLSEYKIRDQARSRIFYRRLYCSFWNKFLFFVAILPFSSIYYFYKIFSSKEFSKLKLLKQYILGTVEGITKRV